MKEQAKFYKNEAGNKIWYLPSKGKNCWHKEDGPAVEWKDGSKSWWINDKRHRTDGPAIDYVDGTKEWYLNNKLHRLEAQGPAIEFANGGKSWYLNGQLHRTGGPAVEWADGTKQWWIDGKELPTEEIESWLNENEVDIETPEGKMAFKLRWI